MSDRGENSSDSESGEYSDDDVEESLIALRGSLHLLEHEFDSVIQDFVDIGTKAHKVEKEIKEHTNLYQATKLDSLLHTYLPIWKQEGRLSQSGSSIQLTQKEAEQIKLKEGWNSVYDVCIRMLDKSLNSNY